MTHVFDGFHATSTRCRIAPLYKDVLQIFGNRGIAETPTLIVNYAGRSAKITVRNLVRFNDNAKLNRFTPASE